MLVILVALFPLVSACDHSPSPLSLATPAPDAPIDNQQPPPRSAPSEAHSKPATLPSASQTRGSASARPSRCEPVPLISAARVASSWPSMIGKRIAIEGVRIETGIDYTEAIASAGGVRFAVLLSPDQVWTASARKTFTIMGSAQVALHGRTTMPELLLESDDRCGSKGA